MKKVFVSLCMAAAVTGLSSCGSTKNAASLATIGGEWNIIEINGTAVVPVSGQEFPYIGFDMDEGRVYGSGGCNRIMGTFALDAKPGVLAMSPLATTRMGCPDMSVEQNVLAALAQVKKFKRLNEGNLLLCTSSNRPVMVLQKKTALRLTDLEGAWFIREVGGMSVPDSLDNQPFIEFNMAEKRLHGNAGCNIINGTLQVDEAEAASISFPQVITTMMACPDMEVEDRILKALDEVRSFGAVSAGWVGLYDIQGTLVLLLEKK